MSKKIRVVKMKKSEIIIIALILLLGVSALLNIGNLVSRDAARQNAVIQIYSCFRDASINLDILIDNIEKGMVDDTANQGTIAMLSTDLVTADTTLKRYASWFPRAGLSYGAFPDFAHIAFTLGFSSGTVNGVGYDGVLLDNVISENETQYIVALRNDIAIIVSDMQSADNVNQNLSIRQLNAILNEFFRKWSYHDENSPFFLLHN